MNEEFKDNNFTRLKTQIRNATPTELAKILDKPSCQYCAYRNSEMECDGNNCTKGITQWLRM